MVGMCLWGLCVSRVACPANSIVACRQCYTSDVCQTVPTGSPGSCASSATGDGTACYVARLGASDGFCSAGVCTGARFRAYVVPVFCLLTYSTHCGVACRRVRFWV